MSVKHQNQLQFEQTKELLTLCKVVESEINHGRKTVNNLNALRRKQGTNKGVSMGPRHFRRGVLMSVLQESARSIPLWIGKPGERYVKLTYFTSPTARLLRAPPLGGAMPACSADFAKIGDHVAALVPEPDVAATAACNLTEGCILAEVVDYDMEKQTYQVEDVDAEEGKMCYTLSRSKVVPLPKWKVNPVTNPEAIFPEGTTVLALYPQTTCFYKAIVDEIPVHVHDEYSLYFEDASYPEGYAPAIRIPQRYVIEFRDKEGGVEGKALSVHASGGSGRKRSR